MSKVEELLEKYNPDGVEDLTLGEICLNHDSKRRPISKGNRIPGNIPYYGANGIQDYVDDYLFNGEYILVGEDGSVITEEGTPIVKWVYGKFWVNNHAHIFSENLNKALLKYVFYILQINKIKDLVRGVPPKLTKESALSISLKIPHIKVQEEIVKILDSFTNLIDALNEELSLRQKQFEYYREKLLTFDEEPTSIFKFTKVLRGKRLTTKELSENANYPVYHGGTEPIGYYNEYNREANTVMIINVGASAGTIGFCNQNFWSSDGCYCLSHNQKIDNKFLYYSLLINEYKIKSQVRYAGIPTLDQRVIENIQLFIPSISIQQSIVEKLDAFESLISSLKEEIALRQKQYEYYREKLLTFN